jgi:hypothetical protein
MCTLVAWILIWVVLDGELTISLLDLELGGARLDAQRIVVFRFFNHIERVAAVGGENRRRRTRRGRCTTFVDLDGANAL